ERYGVNTTWSLALVIVAGVPMTLALTAVAFAAGSVLAALLCWARLQAPGPLRALVRLCTDAIIATPPLIHILWIYYVLPQVIDWRPNAFTVVVIALSASTAALMSEIL